jgi:CHAT domain-containing protein
VKKEMERSELAARLVTAGEDERESLLNEYAPIKDVELAHALKEICLDEWSNSPARAIGVSEALKTLARHTNNPEVIALSIWMAGFTSVVAEGQTERAIMLLEDSEARFLALGKPHLAASTQVIKLYALALAGRYDEAIACGLSARLVLLEHGDIRAAGKIEHNIGNIYLRRDRYREAERFQLEARTRFVALNDQKQLAKIDNNLALIYTAEHKFRRAEQLYDRALKSAEAGGLVLMQAGIEASIGTLALFQGRYDRALDYLERSRRKYAALGMPHQSAVAEMEMADAYLELNLVAEAAATYENVSRTFAELAMRAERARALAQHGHALILLGKTTRAHALLAEAGRLYAAEGNSVGGAVVMLTKAQLHYAEGDYEAAGQAALSAEIPLAEAGTLRRQLQARWLRAEAARALGRQKEAWPLLETALREAELHSQPDIAQLCYTSLGLLAAAEGDAAAAEASFQCAVSLIEELRSPLPTEEFRTAFFSDKLLPYMELVSVYLKDESSERTTQAFRLVEAARSRALGDILGGAIKLKVQPRDSFEAQLMARYEELKEELNWFYSRINRSSQGDTAPSRDEIKLLQKAVIERERSATEIIRQLHQLDPKTQAQAHTIDVEVLQQYLGKTTALVEYASLNDEFIAFVVTDEGIRSTRRLCTEKEAEMLLGRLRFQVETLRYGARRVRRHLKDLTVRAQHYLRKLYELLLKPLEEFIGDRRLVVVPHRALYYVPFHALHDGTSYVIEGREVSYAPSALVLLHCLAQSRRPLQRALLLGVSDEYTPRVADEIGGLSKLFPEAITLLNERATLAALREFTAGVDVLHLACHGQFRPDNPFFSSLRLGDGWLTVRDTYNLDLRCGLVALSACETGINEVAPGDELLGLARGFFSAGAPSLLLSLWTVDDEATVNLMTSFYKLLLAGHAPAQALRGAQLELLVEQPHPFFWAPFIISGRW